MKPAKPLTKEEEEALRRHACPPAGPCDLCRLFATLDQARRGGEGGAGEAKALAEALEGVLAILKKAWTPRGIHAPVGFGRESMEEAVRRANAALAPRRKQDTLKRGSTG